MRAVRRQLDGVAIADGAREDLTFEISVPLAGGGEVLMGRKVLVWVTTDEDVEVTVEYSHDFGTTYVDRGTSDDVTALVPSYTSYDAHGTNVRIVINNSGPADPATVDVDAHLI